MKKLFFAATILFAALSCPRSAHAAWAHIDGCIHDNNTSSATVTCTLANPITGGASIVGCIDWASSSGSVSSVGDGTNSYTPRAGTLLQNASDGWSRECFSKDNLTGGPTVITVTLSGAMSEQLVTIDEYTGALSSGSFDQGTTARQVNPGTASNAVTSGTVTPTVDGELIWGYGGSSLHTSPIYTVGTGFTLRQRLSSKNPTSEDLVQGTAAAIAATFTDNVSSDTSYTTVVTLKPAAAPAGTTKRLLLLHVGKARQLLPLLEYAR
jgi:hypothetical protein